VNFGSNGARRVGGGSTRQDRCACACQGRDLEPEVASGRGTVWSFTVNRHKWSPGLEPPYVLAEVELEEQSGLRLLTSIIDCDDVRIGMPVHVRFEQAGDAWVPVFGP